MRKEYNIPQLNPRKNLYIETIDNHHENEGSAMSELFAMLTEELNHVNQRISVYKKDLELLNLGEDSEKSRSTERFYRMNWMLQKTMPA